MSLSRSFINEFRPFFRMIEDSGMRTPRAAGGFDDPFFNTVNSIRPAVDVHEDDASYIVEAELPGVKKENVNVHIGEGGRSLTIEGRVQSKRHERAAPQTDAGTATDTAVTNRSDGQVSQQLSSERSFVGNASFTRSVWLPRPVDPKKVSAKLADGVLTVKIDKAGDEVHRVTVE